MQPVEHRLSVPEIPDASQRYDMRATQRLRDQRCNRDQQNHKIVDKMLEAKQSKDQNKHEFRIDFDRFQFGQEDGGAKCAAKS